MFDPNKVDFIVQKEANDSFNTFKNDMREQYDFTKGVVKDDINRVKDFFGGTPNPDYQSIDGSDPNEVLSNETMQEIVNNAEWSAPGSYDEAHGHHMKVGLPDGSVRYFQNADGGYREVTAGLSPLSYEHESWTGYMNEKNNRPYSDFDRRLRDIARG